MSGCYQQGRMILTGGSSDYPDEAGHRGVSTSVEAAEGISPHLGRLQRIAFEQVSAAGRNGLTAHELAAATGIPREATRPRLSELRRKGRIVDSGCRRPNASGKRAICWILPEYKGGEA